MARLQARAFAARVRALAAVAVAGLMVLSAPAAAAGSPRHDPSRTFRVMTQNLYLGANLQPLFGASGADLVAKAAAVYAHMKQVDFPARAKKIADLIGEEHPDAVGLQEAALWQKLAVGPAGQLSVVETTDYLGILLGALAADGLHYRVAAVDTQFTNASDPLPIAIPPTVAATFTDRDAILVRTDLPHSELATSNPAGHSFTAALYVPSPGNPGQTLRVPRGWSSVDIKIRGKSYRFADTHLEAYATSGCDAGGHPSLSAPFVRNQQAAELAATLAASPLPVVLVGDLNALPNDPCDALPILRSAGFVDGWAEAMGTIPAYTAGQTDDLDNFPSKLDHQVDYVLHNRPGYLRAVPGTGAVVGGRPGDRTPSGLWPSDHAAMALSMRIAKP